MTTARTCSGGRRGFTLIELMAVLVIITIMTAMIIPEMKGSYQDALLRSSGRELMNVFNSTCSRAVALNQLHHVRLDPSTGKYVVEKHVLQGAADDFTPVEDMPGGAG